MLDCYISIDRMKEDLADFCSARLRVLPRRLQRLAPLFVCFFLVATCLPSGSHATEEVTYLRKVADALQASYFPPHCYEYGAAGARFQIMPDGTAQNVCLVRHPVYLHSTKTAKSADQAVIDAIKNATLPRPPAAFGNPLVVLVRWKGLNQSLSFTPCIVEVRGQIVCDSKTARTKALK